MVGIKEILRFERSVLRQYIFSLFRRIRMNTYPLRSISTENRIKSIQYIIAHLVLNGTSPHFALHPLQFINLLLLAVQHETKCQNAIDSRISGSQMI